MATTYLPEKDVKGLTDSDSDPQTGFGEVRNTANNDAVFGEITEDGPNYRNVGWIGSVALMMKTQIGLGVLSIPAVFDALGLIPGLICMLAIGAITTWSDYVIGDFKINHPEVYSIDDVGFLLFGNIGRQVIAVMFFLFWVFLAGSAMLGISIALNTLSTHSICTAGFVAIAALIGLGFASIQTLGRITWLAWIGVFGIMTAIFTVTIAVGVQDKPYAAPAEIEGKVWVSDYKLTNTPTFENAIASICSLVFAYAGTPGFFSIASEMREPRLYTRSVMICQGIISVVYVIIGVVVYYYCGSYVASPALGSAGPTIKKVSYGFALPGLIVSCAIFIHLAAKYSFIRVLRGTKDLTSNTPKHWIVWMGSILGVAGLAYIIASSVPVFGSLISLVGALFGTFLCFQPYGCMWLYDNWKKERTSKWYAMVAWCAFVIVIGTFIMIAGTYGAIRVIIDDYNTNGGTKAFSCADNSNSVGGH